MKTQMKAMQHTVTTKEREQGLTKAKDLNSEECEHPNVEGYKEYDKKYRDLEELYGNVEDFPSDK